MARKYLDDIGVTNRPDLWNEEDKRQEKWTEERNTYGFDERETWALDFTFYCWLYERLKMYLDVNITDLTFHKFEYEDETLTQEECINRMIKGCEIYFEEDGRWPISEENQKAMDDVAKIWAIVLPAMWW